MTTEQTAAPATENGDHVVVSGTVISELQENMRTAGFTEASVEAISELTTKLLEVADEAVAKNDLKPEIRAIHLTRKADGSPFFTVVVETSEDVQVADVTTLTDRLQRRLDANRTPATKQKKHRAVDITSDAVDAAG